MGYEWPVRHRPSILLPLRSQGAALACAALTLLAAVAARAQQPLYGPDGAPTVVQHKRFPLTGRWETSLLLATSVGSALTDQTGLVLQQRYHPNEWLDIGVDALLQRTSLSGLVDQIRARLPPRVDPATSAPNVASELSRGSQLRSGALAAARLAPIYGKLDLAGEVAVHFQAFLLAGVGIGAVHHESVNLCAVAGSAPCQPGQYQTWDALKPLFDAGLGMRFWASDHVTFELQLRAHAYPDSYKEQNDLTDPASGVRRNYLAVLTTAGAGLSVLY